MAAAKRKPQAAQSPNDAYHADVKRKFTLSQDVCEKGKKNALVNQGYYDGPGQWSDTERGILKNRNQPDNYFNETKAGINGMIGLVERGKTDPRALGRTPKDSEASEVMTDALRYVTDLNRFQSIRGQALKDFFIPGICCAVVEIDEYREVRIRKGRYENFFYDPHSREPDFSDARWLGLANYMDEDDALALPYVDTDAKRALITSSVDAGESLGLGQTSEDRPKGVWAWGDSKTRRVMVVQMWHKLRGEWQMCVFVSGGVLQQGPSEYKDDRGRPTCNLIAQSAYVDSDNVRYGAVDDMRGPQDALNKGWSKVQHIISVAKLRIDPGIGDVDAIRKEYAKPDGVIEARDGQVEELGDKQLLPAHIELLTIAEQRMRRQTPTPAAVGRQAAGQSGRALLAEQQAGQTEQAPLLGGFDDWTLRIYRSVGFCIKQFWTAPKYIRVTDDENAPRYILLNQEEPVLDKMGRPQIDQATGQPKTRLVKPAEIDMDIIIDSTPDTASLQEDQYKGLLELATVGAQTQTGTIPFKAIIEASALPRKRQIIDAMEQDAEEKKAQPQQPGPAEQEQAKAAVQLQAKQQMNEMDAQAHAASLARQDQADKAKTDRAAALAEQQFQLKQREMHSAHNLSQQAANSQAVRENQKARMQAKAKPKEGEGGSENAQGELPLGGEDEDMNFNINLSPEVQQALLESIVQTKQVVAQRQVQAADAAAQAQAALPQALMALAQSMDRAATAQERAAQATIQAAQVQAAPKVLRIGPNGEKMAVPMLEAMN
jgi:hypothetical protein